MPLIDAACTSWVLPSRAELAALLRGRDVSAVELTEAFLERIESLFFGRDFRAAEFGNGRDRGNAGDRLENKAACGVPGAGVA